MYYRYNKEPSGIVFVITDEASILFRVSRALQVSRRIRALVFCLDPTFSKTIGYDPLDCRVLPGIATRTIRVYLWQKGLAFFWLALGTLTFRVSI